MFSDFRADVNRSTTGLVGSFRRDGIVYTYTSCFTSQPLLYFERLYFQTRLIMPLCNRYAFDRVLEPGQGPKRQERCPCPCCRYQIFENFLWLSQYATDRN